jgi:hypothetical protein
MRIPLMNPYDFSQIDFSDPDIAAGLACVYALLLEQAQCRRQNQCSATAVAGGHNGGHIRIPLADDAAPERARLLAEKIRQTVIARCGLPKNVVEVYPTQKGLCLPFGVHTHTGKRGTLFLQNDTYMELDKGDWLTTISQAMSLLEAFPPNNLDNLPILSAAPVSHGSVSAPNALQRPQGGSSIQEL